MFPPGDSGSLTDVGASVNAPNIGGSGISVSATYQQEQATGAAIPQAFGVGTVGLILVVVAIFLIAGRVYK